MLRETARFRSGAFGALACSTPASDFATSSIGLPLLNGFVGEFLILSGAFRAKALYGILAASGVIWSAAAKR